MKNVLKSFREKLSNSKKLFFLLAFVGLTLTSCNRNIEYIGVERIKVEQGEAFVTVNSTKYPVSKVYTRFGGQREPHAGETVTIANYGTNHKPDIRIFANGNWLKTEMIEATRDCFIKKVVSLSLKAIVGILVIAFIVNIIAAFHD